MPSLKMIVGLLAACVVGILIGAVATYVITNQQGIHIQSFAVDRHEVLIGDKVTFTWKVSGATDVAFRFVHMPTGSHGDLWEWVYPDVSAGNLPPSGEWSYTVPSDLTDRTFKFELEGSDEAGNKIAIRSEVIVVKYRPCFEGSDECATVPIQTQAILQPFEHGYMLWREDTQTIYVLASNPSTEKRNLVIGWQAYTDTWTEGDSFSLEGQPPSGGLQPNLRFTKIMAINTGLQDDLGWATALETFFEATIQQTRNHCNNGCSPNLLIRLNDGRVLRLSASQPALQQGYMWQITAADSKDSKS